MNNLKIENFGVISSANIDINQINIVSGVNSTGKSTISKLLYCFLRSNSDSRQDLALKSLYDKLLFLLDNLEKYIVNNDIKSENLDMFYDLIETKSNFYYKIDLDYINNFFQDLKDFCEKLNKERSESVNLNILFNEIDDFECLLNMVNENGDVFFNSAFKNIFNSEFAYNLKNRNFQIDFSYDLAKFNFNFIENININSQGFFKINNVYYIDSFPIFEECGKFSSIEHVNNLRNDLKDDNDSGDFFDELVNKEFIELENIVSNIIEGKFIFKNDKFIYCSKDGDFVNMVNTSSGIKQIAIIQMLLANRKLKENTFLIIDEPEINLHPKWQVKFSEVLILLSKCLNVTLYINSHSPFFIEALSLYSKYHGLLNETNFYLTEESSKEGYYNINQVPINNLNSIYDNLAIAIDMIDDLKLKLEFERTDD